MVINPIDILGDGSGWGVDDESTTLDTKLMSTSSLTPVSSQNMANLSINLNLQSSYGQYKQLFEEVQQVARATQYNASSALEQATGEIEESEKLMKQAQRQHKISHFAELKVKHDLEEREDKYTEEDSDLRSAQLHVEKNIKTLQAELADLVGSNPLEEGLQEDEGYISKHQNITMLHEQYSKLEGDINTAADSIAKERVIASQKLAVLAQQKLKYTQDIEQHKQLLEAANVTGEFLISLRDIPFNIKPTEINIEAVGTTAANTQLLDQLSDLSNAASGMLAPYTALPEHISELVGLETLLTQRKDLIVRYSNESAKSAENAQLFNPADDIHDGLQKLDDYLTKYMMKLSDQTNGDPELVERLSILQANIKAESDRASAMHESLKRTDEFHAYKITQLEDQLSDLNRSIKASQLVQHDLSKNDISSHFAVHSYVLYHLITALNLEDLRAKEATADTPPTTSKRELPLDEEFLAVDSKDETIPEGESLADELAALNEAVPGTVVQDTVAALAQPPHNIPEAILVEAQMVNEKLLQRITELDLEDDEAAAVVQLLVFEHIRSNDLRAQNGDEIPFIPSISVAQRESIAQLIQSIRSQIAATETTVLTADIAALDAINSSTTKRARIDGTSDTEEEEMEFAEAAPVFESPVPAENGNIPSPFKRAAADKLDAGGSKKARFEFSATSHVRNGTTSTGSDLSFGAIDNLSAAAVDITDNAVVMPTAGAMDDGEITGGAFAPAAVAHTMQVVTPLSHIVRAVAPAAQHAIFVAAPAAQFAQAAVVQMQAPIHANVQVVNLDAQIAQPAPAPAAQFAQAAVVQMQAPIHANVQVVNVAAQIAQPAPAPAPQFAQAAVVQMQAPIHANVQVVNPAAQIAQPAPAPAPQNVALAQVAPVAAPQGPIGALAPVAGVEMEVDLVHDYTSEDAALYLHSFGMNMEVSNSASPVSNASTPTPVPSSYLEKKRDSGFVDTPMSSFPMQAMLDSIPDEAWENFANDNAGVKSHKLPESPYLTRQSSVGYLAGGLESSSYWNSLAVAQAQSWTTEPSSQQKVIEQRPSQAEEELATLRAQIIGDGTEANKLLYAKRNLGLNSTVV